MGGPSTTGSAALMDRTELYTMLAAVRDDEDILASREKGLPMTGCGSSERT